MGSSCIRNRLFYFWPFYGEICIIFFQMANIFRKLCFVWTFFVSVRFYMILESIFKCVWSHANIVFRVVYAACTDGCLYTHIKSFTHKKYSNATELLKYVWHLKENNTNFTIKWSITKNSISFTGGSKRCNLCLETKRSILKKRVNICWTKDRS